MIEIEQKFEYTIIPKDKMHFLQHTTVYRKYISINPEVRINKRVFETGEIRYNLSFKSDSQLSRREVKIPLAKEQYNELSSIVSFPDIIFEVYEYQIDEKHSISFKEGKNIDIRFAEIEYEDYKDYKENSNIVDKLDFLKKEVTYDRDYYMKYIWERYIKEMEAV